MPAIAVMVLVAGGAALLLLGSKSAFDAAAPDQSADTADTSLETEESMPVNLTGTDASGITNDRSTWPTGSRIWDIAQAIAIAEGADVAGSNPDRLNNPGDISDGAHLFNQEAHSGSQVTHFPDKGTGWSWLYNKLEAIAQGRSHVFSPAMSWTEFAQHYAGDWQNWVNNVTRELGAHPSSTFGDYVNS